MIDHTGYMVSDLEKSVAFYTKALAPIGYTLMLQFPGVAGFGAGGKPDFWIHGDGTHKPHDKLHIAFRAAGRAEVRKFYEAAIAAGGTDNGAPGERPQYHEHYYAAFVRDLDGHNVEVVCHDPFLG
jgi:catechol 2,3-dioxygenase-like lactoylglutathione lyase family enzyme